MAPPNNLINLSEVSKQYAARTILESITLGVAGGDRIGVVGANGQGKSTLLKLIAGAQEPDGGRVTRLGGLRIGLLGQQDGLDGERTVGEVLGADRAQHEWAGSRKRRAILDALLGGVELRRFPAGLHTPVSALSGGERRRTALALSLLDESDLLLLDEPTNHLDVEVIAWLAQHLANRSGALLVITHDRWFLDAVCTRTWEVADRCVHQYEGGYAAYVLAAAERGRVSAAREDRRRQLVRKELAWLRRGPPARTAKPKFRIEAANALIADEPPARDSTELLRFASARLGKKVIEAQRISFSYTANQPVINNLTWLLGPGDRVALVGANGAGKSTLLAVLAGELEPTGGRLERGETVRLAHLAQESVGIPAHRTVLEAVQEINSHATLANGEQISASRLIERLGFRGERARALVKDLSGGELRRLALIRLLIGEPNVLLLDEPTNDLDIETLRALEDLLDHWPGTLVVVSHDRYFIERVTDSVYAVDRAGGIRHLPGGVDQYLTQLGPSAAAGHALPAPGAAPAEPASSTRTRQDSAARATPVGGTHDPGGRELKPGNVVRSARRELARLEREIERRTAREQQLHELMAASASNHTQLVAFNTELQQLLTERTQLEDQWLQTAALLDG
ncbi:MAG: ABC-F family ATP-binding cassette domain-containing protein [Solirubrobacteraceae bacterium]